MNRTHSFYLIVVMIILILAAIAFPQRAMRLFAGNDKVAVLVMDAWDTMPIKYWDMVEDTTIWENWWRKDVVSHIDEVLVPLVDYLRTRGVPIVFSPNELSLNQAFMWELWQEPIINRAEHLDLYMSSLGVKTIYYTGYAANMCLLTKPTGLRAMASIGYDVCLVTDATLVVPSLVDYATMTMGEVVSEVETYGSVTTIDELKQSIRRP